VSIQKPKSEFEQQMIYLEAEIRRLEAEFNMFFAGRLPRPPWETRAKVNALVKKHDQSFIRNTADRFRASAGCSASPSRGVRSVGLGPYRNLPRVDPVSPGC